MFAFIKYSEINHMQAHRTLTIDLSYQEQNVVLPLDTSNMDCIFLITLVWSYKSVQTYFTSQIK